MLWKDQRLTAEENLLLRGPLREVDVNELVAHDPRCRYPLREDDPHEHCKGHEARAHERPGYCRSADDEARERSAGAELRLVRRSPPLRPS